MAATKQVAKKGNGTEVNDVERLKALEKKVDAYISGLKGKGEQILTETKEITDGLRNINPLQIGHRLTNVRELFGIKAETAKGDKKSIKSQMWVNYLRTKVYKLGFKKATVTRYMGAWAAAIKSYPEQFVTELASRMSGEKVTPEKPFGKFTDWVAQSTKKVSVKEDMASVTKSIEVVDGLLFTYKPPTGTKEKKNYILGAYNAVMNALRGELKRLGEVEPLDSLDAKDVFITTLAPYLLAGFGLSNEIVEQVEVATELPPGYEPFTEAEMKRATSPMGEATKTKRGRKARAAGHLPATPTVERRPTLVQHDEEHQGKPAEEKSSFAAG